MSVVISMKKEKKLFTYIIEFYSKTIYQKKEHLIVLLLTSWSFNLLLHHQNISRLSSW